MYLRFLGRSRPPRGYQRPLLVCPIEWPCLRHGLTVVTAARPTSLPFALLLSLRLAAVRLGVGSPVLLGLAAYLHQPGSGFLDTPAPVDRQQAECEIRPADIGASAFASLRGTRHAPLIARPASQGSNVACGTPAVESTVTAGATTPRASSSSRVTVLPGSAWTVSTRGKRRGILLLEVDAAADTGGP